MTTVSAASLPCSAAPQAAWFPLLPYQRDRVQCPAQLTWNNWSRQTGKSFTFTLRRVLRGMHRRRTQLLLSAGERQSRELMQKVRLHCHLLAAACTIRGGPTRSGPFSRLEAVLPGGVRVLALPANPLTIRGYTGDVFLDEFAMHRDDRAIWAALLPTLLRGDGEIDIASTPRGRNNVFARLRDNPDFDHSTLTLPQAIAAGLDADANAVRSALADEQLYRQEFLCEFDADEHSLLSHARIVACSDPTLSKSPARARLADRTARLYAGVDVGRLRDLTVIWLWDRRDDAYHTVGVIELERRGFDEQFRAIAAVLEHRSVRRLCIDATGIGLALAEQIERRFGSDRVESVTFTAPVQAELASRLRMLAEQGRLRIPPDPDVHNDWHAVQRVVTSTGHVRFVADRGPGGHADRFWAAALGLHAAWEPADAPPEAFFGQRLRFAYDGAIW